MKARERGRGREKRWVVREGDGTTLAEILKRAGESVAAVAEGRVFVGRARAKSAEQRVQVGDDVRIGRAGAGAAADVIWKRDGMIACSKPAGIPTVADHAGAAHALVAVVAASVGRSVGELRLTSRLDREVSGVVVFATSAEVEARLRLAREEGRYDRRYVAIAVDRGGLAGGTWDAPIGAGADPLHRAAFGAEAKPAATRWTVVARAGGFAMLVVEPQTGRTHQIRVHASHAGAPLLGDVDYGGPARITMSGGRVIALARIALHAARVTVPDARGKPLAAIAPVPAELQHAWTELGGAAEAWDTAMSCELEAPR